MAEPGKYLTVRQSASAELIVRKSRFIAYVSPASTEEEAAAFVASIRERHKDATHNVPAYRIGPTAAVERASDDGEPSGTAGRPVLEVLKRENVTDVAAVVTRYFGGILLGAPGLIRAYGQAARMGLDAAGIAERRLISELEVVLDYPLVGKVQHMIPQLGGRIADSAYAERVTFRVLVDADAADAITRELVEATGAQVEVRAVGNRFN